MTQISILETIRPSLLALTPASALSVPNQNCSSWVKVAALQARPGGVGAKCFNGQSSRRETPWELQHRATGLQRVYMGKCQKTSSSAAENSGGNIKGERRARTARRNDRTKRRSLREGSRWGEKYTRLYSHGHQGRRGNCSTERSRIENLCRSRITTGSNSSDG